jgi:O-antigen/teichoic acid export membrane protein
MSAAASALAAAMGMIVNLVSVPLLLDSLGRDRFGVWMTIYSFVSMLSFLDFGIGLGLLTILARCSGLDDKRSAREHVSSAILILTVLASILALVLLFVHPFVPWAKLLGVDSLSLAPEAASSVLALGLCILIALPTSIGGRVQAAYQRGYVASLWDAAARVAVVVCLVLVARRNSDIPVVVTIVVGLPALFGAFNMLFLFTRQMPWLRPSWSHVQQSSSRSIIQGGALFFLLQTVTAVAFASDNLVISHMLGSGAVSDYTVPRTLFQIVASAAMLVLMPLWPAYGEAMARGEHAWVRRTLRRSLIVALSVTSLASLTLVLVTGDVLSFWVGSAALQPPLSLLLGFAAWTIVSTCGSTLAMVLNAASKMKFQLYTAVSMGLAAVTAKVFLSEEFGLAGVVWGTVSAYVVFSLLPTLFYIRSWLRAN